MRILVVGGSGSLGRAIIQSISVTCESAFIVGTYGDKTKIEGHKSLCFWISYIDLLTTPKPPVCNLEFDIIIITAGRYNIRTPNRYFGQVFKDIIQPLSNILFSVNVANSAHFIYISSANALRTLHCDPQIALGNCTVYGLEKQIMESTIALRCASHDANYSILRLNNIFDSSLRKDGFGVFWHMSRAILEGRSPTFIGDYMIDKDYIDVNDAASFIAQLVLSKTTRNTTLELCSGYSVSAFGIYELMLQYVSNAVFDTSIIKDTRRSSAVILKHQRELKSVYQMITESLSKAAV